MGFKNHRSELWVFVFRGFVSRHIGLDLEILQSVGAREWEEEVEEGQLGGVFEGGDKEEFGDLLMGIGVMNEVSDYGNERGYATAAADHNKRVELEEGSGNRAIGAFEGDLEVVINGGWRRKRLVKLGGPCSLAFDDDGECLWF